MREQGRSARAARASAGYDTYQRVIVRPGVTERHPLFGSEEQLLARRETMELVDTGVCHCRGWSSRLPWGARC